jgi:ribosomal protein S18 acetylase RimI-like enzyme
LDIKFEILKENELKEAYNLCKNVFGEYASFDEVKKTYQLCKNDNHYYFIVGKSNGKIIAYTTMIIFHNLFDGMNPIATLWYVCVDKNYRRNKVASSMFNEIERIANENYCEIIYFTSFKNNFSAHKFYKSKGYSDSEEKAFVKYLYEEWEN